MNWKTKEIIEVAKHVVCEGDFSSEQTGKLIRLIDLLGEAIERECYVNTLSVTM